MADRLKREIRNATARVLVRRRLEAGLSQEKLAELADLERTYISFLERRLRTPGFETLFRLAKGLGTTASELVTEIEGEITR